MKIKLFNFIDECVNLYNKNYERYNEVNLILINFFIKNYQYKNDSITSVFSRIKNSESLREKLFRNKFYLKFNTCEEVLDNLNDPIGLTLECRFIKDETNIYKLILNDFVLRDNGYYQSKLNDKLFLNLSMAQPQLQRNGFPIYRIDGYYFDQYKINFELQIKAMVHSFWSDIEHQVVYKNTKMVLFNSLVTKMLASIRDNLEVVDSQLEIIHNQILGTKNEPKSIGITPESFKMVVATSINELVSESMIKNIGVATDFKHCSAILSQFIYITQFLNAENPSFKMIEYFEHLNFLKVSELDFTENIVIEEFKHDDVFCRLIGNYWLKVMNIDYDWHVFFVMCFALQAHDLITSFVLFIETIRNLIIPQSLIKESFNNYSKEDKAAVINFLKEAAALSLIEINKLDIVHESHLFELFNEIKNLIKDMELRYSTYQEFISEKKIIDDYLSLRIKAMF